MKKIKLLLAAMAAMVGMGASAQSWIPSEVGEGNFVLYNVGAGQYFVEGNGWGTQASITTNASAGSARQVELIAFDGKYKIRTGINGTGYGVEYLNGGTIYTDQSRNKNSTWTFTAVPGAENGPVYTIMSADNHEGGSGVYMTASAENTIVGPGTDASSSYAQWKLLDAAKVPLLSLIDDYNSVKATIVSWTTSPAVTNAEEATATFNTALEAADNKVAAATTVDEINEAIADLKAAGNTFLENVIVAGGLDITNAWITNPAPGIAGNLNGWTNSGSPGLQYQLYEYWNVSGGSTKQTLVNLPKGAYQLSAIAYTRDNMKATLYAGDKTVNLVGCGSVNDRNGGNNWIAQGNGVNNLNFTLDEATASLEIGLIADNTTPDYWMCWRSFSLTYYGDPINLAKADLAAAVAAAETASAALEGTIPAAVYTALNAVVTENDKTYSTTEEYEAAIDAINNAVTSAQALVAPYAAYKVVANDAAIVAVASETINAQNVAVEEATTIEAIEACTATLQAAIDALAFDITTFTITNPTAQTKDGWEGDDFGDKSDGVCEYWNKSGVGFHQTVSLPAGTYRLTVVALQRTGMTGVVYAGENNKTIAQVASSTVNYRSQAATWFDAGNGRNYVYFTLAEAGDITIGLTADATTGDHWTVWQSFKLDTFQESVAAGYLAPGYATLVESAQATHDDAAYANVTGEEKTALETAIAATPSTVAEYEAAIEALNNAVAAFTEAKDSYDGLVTARTTGATYTTELWPRASAAKKTALDEAIAAAAPSNAADAVTKTNAIVTAYRQFVESNGLAEGVDVAINFTETYLSGADPDVNTGWTNGIGVDYRDNEIYTQGDGTTSGEYYDGGWSPSAAVNINITRELTLPVGQYQLQITARGSSSLTSYTMSIGGESVDLPREGADAATGTFGHGWSDKYVVFESDGTTPLTLAITATSTEYQQWISFNRLRLMKLDAIIATSEDYANLNNAITAAEAKVIGFEEGEYAPYNNADAIAALAAAKAIDQDAANDQASVQEATTNLTGATWNVNAEEVNGIYDGFFTIQTVPASNTKPLGWNRCSTTASSTGYEDTGYQTRIVTIPTGVTTSNVGMMTKMHSFYGDQENYTLPLKANTYYTLSFKYAGYNDKPTLHINVYSADGTKVANSTSFTSKDDKGHQQASSWSEFSYTFKTTVAGNYVIGFIKDSGATNQKQAVFTDIELKRIPEVALSENTDWTPTAYEAANVTLTRTIKANTWNTFVVPFSINNTELKEAFGEEVKVAEFRDDGSEEAVDLYFEEMDTPAITANKPVLLKTNTEGTSYVFENRSITTETPTATGTFIDFVGTYEASTLIPAGNYFISGNKLWKSDGTTKIKGTRAYIDATKVPASDVKLFIDDIETSIEEINGEDMENGLIYNLAGQRIQKMQKGINIVNGKKILY